MNDNGVIRKRNGYTTTGNTLTRDITVSLKAKGLYLVIMSYISMPNLSLTKGFIQNQCAEGSKSFESSWNELKEKGYLKVYFIQSKNGFRTEYELLDEPSFGAHTFYLDADGNVKSTNLDRAKKKADSSCMEEAENPPEEKTAVNQKEEPLFDRYPHFGSNGNGTNGKGNNANGGNKINNTTNKLNNNDMYVSYLSINPDNNDGWIDNLDNTSEEIKEDSNTPLPYSLSENRSMVERKIKELADYDNNLNTGEYNAQQKHTYKLIIDCIIDMLCDKQIQTYCGSDVTNKNVFDKFNELLSKNYHSGASNELQIFIDFVMEDFISYSQRNEIKNFRSYMKGCLWNMLLTYHLKWDKWMGL